MSDDFPEVGAGENPHLDYVPQKRTHPNWVEGQSHQTVTTVSGTDGPYMVYSIQRTLVAYAWNPRYKQDAICKCGHAYYRHFDTYEDMYPVGCKYCECNNFELKA
jgi:hypothetical protein